MMVSRRLGSEGAELIRGMAEEVGGKLLPKARQTVGDIWGWKGGRSGEISGSEYVDEHNRLWSEVKKGSKPKRAKNWYISDNPYRIESWYPDATPEYKRAVLELGRLKSKGVGQLKGSSTWKNILASERDKLSNNLTGRIRTRGVERDWDLTMELMKQFKAMEEAGVPRELTGALAKNQVRIVRKSGDGVLMFKNAAVPVKDFKTLYVDKVAPFLRILNDTGDVPLSLMVGRGQVGYRDAVILRRLSADPRYMDPDAIETLSKFSSSQRETLETVMNNLFRERNYGFGPGFGKDAISALEDFPTDPEVLEAAKVFSQGWTGTLAELLDTVRGAMGGR